MMLGLAVCNGSLPSVMASVICGLGSAPEPYATLVSNMGLRLPLPAINEQFFTVAVFNVSSNLLIFVIIQSNTTTVYNHLQRNSRHIRWCSHSCHKQQLFNTVWISRQDKTHPEGCSLKCYYRHWQSMPNMVIWSLGAQKLWHTHA